MKVLIADDDRVYTTSIAARLRSKGWEVQVAQDAMQAFMFAQRTQPSVIVLDLGMPGGTGFDVLNKLQASGRTASIPVVIASGSVRPEEETKARELGAVEFLHKPVDPQMLHETLLGYLPPDQRSPGGPPR